MLVLSRKTEQKIRIGKNIVITVLRVSGDQVSLGIEAPRDLEIVREELLIEELAKEAAEENRKSETSAKEPASLKSFAKRLKKDGD